MPPATPTLPETDPFHSPWQVLARARDHIHDLNLRVKAFFDTKPYTRVVEIDANSGQEAHKIRLTDRLPNGCATVAKDALGNLRDVLDHAVYASSVSLRPGKKLYKTGFPFANDAAGVHNKLNKELTDVPPEIRTLLEALRPHKTGNQLLWGLNCTRNVKTHRILVPLGAASMGNSLNIRSGVFNGPSEIGYNRWDAAKNEVEYLRLGPGSKVDYQVNATFDVLFGNVEVFGGKQAITTLRAASGEIERILLAIEAETARLLRPAS